MKLAVLADIHANLPALQTVLDHVERWQPDHVVVAGDTVNRGPRPAECLNIVLSKQLQQGWLTVIGNHEEYVISQSKPDAPRSGPKFEVVRNSYWTYQQLGGEVSALTAMPFKIGLPSPDGAGPVTVAHSSMRGTRDGIFPETKDERLRKQIDPQASLFCVGHTHRPLVRMIDRTLVVNVGSVGLPFDGDYRAGYAQLTWRPDGWRAEIIRLDYDRESTDQDMLTTGYLDDAGPLAQLIRVELRAARSLLFDWTMRYQAQVLAGELSMEESVQKFLAELDIHR